MVCFDQYTYIIHRCTVGIQIHPSECMRQAGGLTHGAYGVV